MRNTHVTQVTDSASQNTMIQYYESLRAQHRLRVAGPFWASEPYLYISKAIIYPPSQRDALSGSCREPETKEKNWSFDDHTIRLLYRNVIGMSTVRTKKQSLGIPHVLMAVTLKVTVFYNVAPCSLLQVCRRFRGACDRPDDAGKQEHLQRR